MGQFNGKHLGMLALGALIAGIMVVALQKYGVTSSIDSTLVGIVPKVA